MVKPNFSKAVSMSTKTHSFQDLKKMFESGHIATDQVRDAEGQRTCTLQFIPERG